MREIVLDTETTGLDPFSGDRIVEIGCVELFNHLPTGRVYHQYINPERAMSEEVIAVHGLTEEFLSDKPKFMEIASDFLDFIGSDSHLIIHNAPFDMKFLNAELSWVNKENLSFDRVIDTLVIARKKFPGSRVNLNELCKRFGVDNSARTVHGALLDSELLAEVYLELIGGREPGLILDKKKETVENNKIIDLNQNVILNIREIRDFPVSEEESQQHIEFINKIKNNLWMLEEV
ncbi:MAG: DNA polymerase III subunit epsilon [Lactobacillales bacterium]|jgi:DNA polymerase-3 subunit epsilon|nr:DNA polymerase III subunit epsilon [Lactobacillales bacterium]